MDDIDFVVTYLDGTDPDWLAERARYASRADDGSADEARFRNMDNFQYWFRAVEKFAPWVHRIHLVTWGHVPDWLDVTHPKIHVVEHSEIIPPEYLPTFNSNVIELHFDRIAGITERFVNFNDDVFLAGATEPKDFFAGDLPVMQIMHTPVVPSEEFNVAIFYNTLALNEHRTASTRLITPKTFSLRNGVFAVAANVLMVPILLYFRKFVGFRPEHVTQPVTRRTYVEVRETMGTEVQRLLADRFRTTHSVSVWLLQDYPRSVGRFQPHNAFRFGRMVPFRDGSDYAKMFSSGYKVVCINDGPGMSAEAYAAERDKLKQVLADIFPVKCSFEL